MFGLGPWELAIVVLIIVFVLGTVFYALHLLARLVRALEKKTGDGRARNTERDESAALTECKDARTS